MPIEATPCKHTRSPKKEGHKVEKILIEQKKEISGRGTREGNGGVDMFTINYGSLCKFHNETLSCIINVC